MVISFRKRLKIAPGLYLNVSSGGTSWSVGAPGATLNFGGRRGARATVGITGWTLSLILCNCQRIKGDRSGGHRTR
ncbi:DUF4236 domain-containing protein [Serratia symbiotica]|uniref:DUF4236 domain-containing protein n=1 Tax=Serratia symbiotica TaxID=138074 RepID=UPI0011F1253B|nr:DUF4236 domain-containing protein [Serratia symbiotica]